MSDGVLYEVHDAKWDSSHANFEIPDLPAGQFHLNARLKDADKASGLYIKSVTLQGQDCTDEPIAVDGKTGPVEIVVGDETGSVEATVNDADGHPVSASIVLIGSTGRRIVLTSGDDGHASDKYVPTGEYRAWAFDTLATVPYAEDEWMRQNAGPGESLRVASGGGANVTLKRIPAPPD